MVWRNGLITKDKFCHSRQTKLQLNWSRYDVWLQRKAKTSHNKPPESGKETGGTNEARMASEATDSPSIGRDAALGSSLPTAIGMGSSDSGDRTNRSKATRDSGGEKR